jgi:hypothetical protein
VYNLGSFKRGVFSVSFVQGKKMGNKKEMKK